MIELTKLNGNPLIVHAQQIESIEQSPDTRVTLLNGKQLYVQETPAEVQDRARRWYAAIASGTYREGED